MGENIPTSERLQRALDWLYSTQTFGIKLGLDNINRLLRECRCNPMPTTKVVQVAGTNGKGSTSAMIESVARAHGLRTGLFTSPHLVRFAERIKVDGAEITDKQLASLLEEVRILVQAWDPHPTFFELSLAIAMRHFLSSECELIILEVGMGGRLDATSAVPKDLAVITPIGMDHQQYLGDTIQEIAGEKGGIMRPGVPCLSAPQDPLAAGVLQEIAEQLPCELSSINQPQESYELSLLGEHQQWNAALAVQALRCLYPSLEEDAIVVGLRNVQWPGRFQIIAQDTGHLTVLDCCHNVHSADILAAQWREQFGDLKAHLIFGAARDKNVEGVLEVLLPICESVEVYTINNPRAASGKELCSLVRRLDSKVKCRAINSLSAAHNHPSRLVTGSIFLVGEWLELYE